MNTFRLRTLALVLLTVAMPAWPAIDCSRARSNAEKMLCSNVRLMRADEQLALAYREALRRGVNPQELIASQRTWVTDSRDVCNDVECMLKAYDDRIADIESR